MQYKAKDTRKDEKEDRGGKVQKRGKQEESKREVLEIEIEPFDDDEMGAQLSENFAEYCMLMDREDRPEEEEEGEEPKKVEEKKPNLELYQKLKERNGKQGDQILSSLFSKVFE